IGAAAGGVSQLRECTARLLEVAKGDDVPIFLVGHVTKEGAVAGPRVLEHIVDAVLYLEGERFHAFRILRGTKNRFGSTDEVGVFEMGESGLREVTNPSEVFLEERSRGVAGSVVVPTVEGTRPLLVEVQALVTPTAFGLPRRTVNGADAQRVLLLLAVLAKRAGLSLGSHDVYVNLVRGLRIREPAADLALGGDRALRLRGPGGRPPDCRLAHMFYPSRCGLLAGGHIFIGRATGAPQHIRKEWLEWSSSGFSQHSSVSSSAAFSAPPCSTSRRSRPSVTASSSSFF